MCLGFRVFETNLFLSFSPPFLLVAKFGKLIMMASKKLGCFFPWVEVGKSMAWCDMICHKQLETGKTKSFWQKDLVLILSDTSNKGVAHTLSDDTSYKYVQINIHLIFISIWLKNIYSKVSPLYKYLYSWTYTKYVGLSVNVITAKKKPRRNFTM